MADQFHALIAISSDRALCYYNNSDLFLSIAAFIHSLTKNTITKQTQAGYTN